MNRKKLIKLMWSSCGLMFAFLVAALTVGGTSGTGIAYWGLIAVAMMTMIVALTTAFIVAFLDHPLRNIIRDIKIPSKGKDWQS